MMRTSIRFIGGACHGQKKEYLNPGSTIFRVGKAGGKTKSVCYKDTGRLDDEGNKIFEHMGTEYL